MIKIPDVYKDYSKQNINLPSECPVCHGNLEILPNGFVKCVNPECTQKIIHKVANLFSSLNIYGSGDVFIQNMVGQKCDNKISSIADVVSICGEGNIGTFISAAGDANGRKIFAATVNAAKMPITMSKFISLFDFDGFSEARLSGLEVSPLFSKWYDDPYFIIDYIETSSAETLASELSIDGISSYDVKMNLFFQMIQILPDIKDTVRLAKKYGYFTFEKPASSTKLSGLSFCFTGAMQYKREDLENTVRTYGGKVKGVSKGLSYLVQADENSTSTKSKKAKELGINIISPESFIALMKNNGINTTFG